MSLDIDRLVQVAIDNARFDNMTTTITVTVRPNAPIQVQHHETWELPMPSTEPQTTKPAPKTAPTVVLLDNPTPEQLAVPHPQQTEVPEAAPSLPAAQPAVVPQPQPAAPSTGALKINLAPIVVSLHPAPRKADGDDELVGGSNKPSPVLPVPGIHMTNDPATDPYYMPNLKVDTTPSVAEGDIIELDTIFPGFAIEIHEVECVIGGAQVMVVDTSHELPEQDADEQAERIKQALQTEGYGTWEVLFI